MREAESFFKRSFGYPPVHIVRAPGRLELLGNHGDYNEGIVLALAIDRYLHIASAPRTDGKIELVSSAFHGREVFWSSEFKKNSAASWTDYVKGVFDQLRKRGVHFTGFNAAVHSTIPIGAGMSSSAALEIATALTVRALHPFSLGETGATLPPRRDVKGRLPPLKADEKMRLARLCHAAEQQFVGVDCGLLDQISSLFGKAWSVLSIDCRFQTVETTPLIGEAVVVCDSGVKRELADGRYNELHALCKAAARALNAKSLRSVESKHLAANKTRLTEREYQCAYHVVGEIQRVVAAERALRDEDLRQLGQYLFQSHESSRDHLQNSCPELDLLVELARTHPGCHGARLTGGGLGGATINLVAYHEAENFMETIAQQYKERTGQKLVPMVCQIVDGAA